MWNLFYYGLHKNNKIWKSETTIIRSIHFSFLCSSKCKVFCIVILHASRIHHCEHVWFFSDLFETFKYFFGIFSNRGSTGAREQEIFTDHEDEVRTIKCIQELLLISLEYGPNVEQFKHSGCTVCVWKVNKKCNATKGSSHRIVISQQKRYQLIMMAGKDFQLTVIGSSASSILMLLTSISPYSPMHQTATLTKLS